MEFTDERVDYYGETIQPIDLANSLNMSLSFNLVNAIKYLKRSMGEVRKDGMKTESDRLKAMWYINKQLEAEEEIMDMESTVPLNCCGELLEDLPRHIAIELYDIIRYKTLVDTHTIEALEQLLEKLER